MSGWMSNSTKTMRTMLRGRYADDSSCAKASHSIHKSLHCLTDCPLVLQKRLAKEAKELERIQKAHAKVPTSDRDCCDPCGHVEQCAETISDVQKGGDAAELEGKVKELEVKRAAAAISSTKTFYKVTVKVRPCSPTTLAWCCNAEPTTPARFHCQDNGAGMPHDDIPNLLGRVLSGTKYGVKQTRGKFGLGAKMALIWSKMSTGLPIEIWSAQEHQTYISRYKLDIDIHRCCPELRDA